MGPGPYLLQKSKRLPNEILTFIQHPSLPHCTDFKVNTLHGKKKASWAGLIYVINNKIDTQLMNA
jgi:hypothetical protein